MITSFRDLGINQNEIVSVDWNWRSGPSGPVYRIDRSGVTPSRPWWAGSEQEPPAPVPPVELPALAIIMRFMAKRPSWEDKQPFAVPDDLYERGLEEMREQMKKRGFAVPIDKNMRVPHFLVLGTPVVAKVEA